MDNLNRRFSKPPTMCSDPNTNCTSNSIMKNTFNNIKIHSENETIGIIIDNLRLELNELIDVNQNKS